MKRLDEDWGCYFLDKNSEFVEFFIQFWRILFVVTLLSDFDQSN